MTLSICLNCYGTYDFRDLAAYTCLRYDWDNEIPEVCCMSLHNSLTKERGLASSQAGAPRLFEGERLLIGTGLLGFFMALAVLVIIGLQGPTVGAEGDLESAFRFDLALGLFVLFTAAILPLAGFTERGRRRWRNWTALFSVWMITHETVQNLRGFDPRFTTHGIRWFDFVPNYLFSTVSLVVAILYAILFIQFFRGQGARAQLVNLGIRYGMVSTMLGMANGVLMSVIGSLKVVNHFAGQPFTLEPGHSMWVHFAGFTGLKTLLLTGWLAERVGQKSPVLRRLVHVAGVAWQVAIGFISLQSYLYEEVVSVTPISVLGALCLVVWGIATLRIALLAVRQPKTA
jgi:hypothetical protein